LIGWIRMMMVIVRSRIVARSALYGLDLSHMVYVYYYCSVSRKNLQEAFGKDYTHEKVDAIMRVSVVVYCCVCRFGLSQISCTRRVSLLLIV
jgi:hypothetical protein